MKVAVVVPGRFYAFDLARALSDRGHQVTVFTNYPKWAARRFGLTDAQVRTLWPHGVSSRAAWRLKEWGLGRYPSGAVHAWFGRWAARQLARERWDVVHGFSGSSEEVMLALKGTGTRTLLARGSAHIRTQARILGEEEARAGVRLDKPDAWMIAREEREYELADRIVVLSTFARTSFVDEGVDPDKLDVLPLAASERAFRPDGEQLEARCRRIASGQPLRVLYVGALSLQKGLFDMDAIVRRLAGRGFVFRFVGSQTGEAVSLVSGLKGLAEFVPKQPEHELRNWYAQADVFLFPTLQDGFAVVLAQAHAAALPLVASRNSGAPDLVQDGRTGWVLPIRAPEAYVERLSWCADHREALAEMVRRIYRRARVRDWDDVAADFERLCVTARDEAPPLALAHGQ